MGREVRMVPSNWEHPKSADGHFIPLLGDSFKERVAKWDEEARQWNNGFVWDYQTRDWQSKVPLEHAGTFSKWNGDRPDEKDYMPDWPKAERTHYQMYEDTSEGTPISPVMETPEALARWLADNNASAFAGIGASYEQWLATIKRGWAVSAVIVQGRGLISGVEGLHEK